MTGLGLCDKHREASRHITACAGAAAILLFSMGATLAQETQEAKFASTSISSTEERPPIGERGLFGAIKRWIGESISDVKENFDLVGDAAGELSEQAGDAAKEAAGGVVWFPTTTVVSGRQHCAAAPNGGPDCRAATEALCRAKGYATGRSLDIQSAQKCPAWVWLSGRQPPAGECSRETYVTRAMCQ